MSERPTLTDRLSNALFLGLMGLARLLPYHRRIPLMGWLFAQVIAPLAGWRRRIRDNLALARPDLSRSEVKALVRAVPRNAGRAMAETYSGEEFSERMRRTGVIEGPGLEALQDAFESSRPVVLASAHLGNYDATRAIMVAQGWPVGGLYRAMNNPFFNRHYVSAITTISEPLFSKDRAGLAAMIRFLRGGGWLALGFDQYDRNGAELHFFGLPTNTVLTPAELAIRYDAPLLPIHAIRQPDGLSFRIHAGAPVQHGEPRVMMQALNDDLEAVIRRHMDQWFWIHRRWK